MEGRYKFYIIVNFIFLFGFFASAVNASDTQVSVFQNNYEINNNYAVSYMPDYRNLTIRINISLNETDIEDLVLNISSNDDVGEDFSYILKPFFSEYVDNSSIFYAYIILNNDYNILNNYTLEVNSVHKDKLDFKLSYKESNSTVFWNGPLYIYIDNTPPQINSSIINNSILLNYTRWYFNISDPEINISGVWGVDSTHGTTISVFFLPSGLNNTKYCWSDLNAKALRYEYNDQMNSYNILVQIYNGIIYTSDNYNIDIDLEFPQVFLQEYNNVSQYEDLFYLNNNSYFLFRDLYLNLSYSEEIKNCSYVFDNSSVEVPISCNVFSIYNISQKNHTLTLYYTDLANKTSNITYNIVYDDKVLECMNDTGYCVMNGVETDIRYDYSWEISDNVNLSSMSRIVYSLNLTNSSFVIYAVKLPKNINYYLYSNDSDCNMLNYDTYNLFYCSNLTDISQKTNLKQYYLFTDNVSKPVLNYSLSGIYQDTSNTSYVDGDVYLRQNLIIKNNLEYSYLTNVSWNISHLLNLSKYNYSETNGVIGLLNESVVIPLHLHTYNMIKTLNYTWNYDEYQTVGEYTYIYYNTTVLNRENTSFKNLKLYLYDKAGFNEFLNNSWELIDSNMYIDINALETKNYYLELFRKKVSSKTITEHTVSSDSKIGKEYIISIHVDEGWTGYGIKYKMILDTDDFYKWDEKENLKIYYDGDPINYTVSGNYLYIDIGQIDNSESDIVIKYDLAREVSITKESGSSVVTKAKTESVKSNDTEKKESHVQKNPDIKKKITKKQSVVVDEKNVHDIEQTFKIYNKTNEIKLEIINPFDSLKNISFEIIPENKGLLNISMLNIDDYPSNKVIAKQGLIELRLNITLLNNSNKLNETSFKVVVRGLSDNTVRTIEKSYSLEILSKKLDSGKSKSLITGLFGAVSSKYFVYVLLILMGVIVIVTLIRYLSFNSRKPRARIDAQIIKKQFKR